ncbi:hypothetical protein PHAVU_008G284500 [Phaseolus vulgaris]
MDIISDVLSGILKDLVCGAVNQLHYPFCFNGFVKELEQEEVNFTDTKMSVEDRVTHARKQTLKTEVMDKWLENANIDAEEVKRLLKEAKAKNNCCFGYCPNWILRYRLGKKLANKKTDLQKIIQEGKQYIQLERTASIPSNTLDILTEKCMNFESRKVTSNKLMEALKDDGVAMIGLYGMGGCGKTTLAMEIKKMAEDEHLFDKIIFVPVSSTVEVPRIQEKIASSLEYKFPENEEMERAQRLCMRLTQEKNILMILDDVWEKLDFGHIGIPSSEHHKGCKILITTRLEEVCTSMDCQRKIYLPILTNEEAWTLFQKKAVIFENTPETIKHLAKPISDECKGLPVAIAAVAGSLKHKEEVLWRVALNRLRSSKPINVEKGLQDPYKCLQLSYDNLDSEEAKSLFLLCSVFPEDYEIPVECLIRCAIGLGMVGEVNPYENARSEVMAAKIKLVSSCLLLDADDESVKMHDLVRDVAQWIAKNEKNIIKCETENDVTLEQSIIRYLWCVKFPNDMDCSNLEFLHIRTKLEVSDGIFERMGKLRVLIITNPEEYDRLWLSTRSFKTLINLRCLVLQYWVLSDISFVRDMKKLESLSLHGCSWPPFIDMQTDVAFTQLKNLKLLEFNECDIEIKNLEEIKRIPLLEELYIIQTGSKHNDRKLIECFNLFSFTQTLQRYGIVLGENFSPIYIPSEFFSCQRTLLVNYFNVSNEVIKGLANKSKELFVGNIEGGVKNMMPDIFEIKGGMNELNNLLITNCEEIEYLVDTDNALSKVGNLFSKLHFLRIYNMKHLRALWHGSVHGNGNGSFEKLEKLQLRDCPELTSLFMYVIAPGEYEVGHSMQSKKFQNLKEVAIQRCGKLNHVFSPSIIGDLSQLIELKIYRCDMLEQIIGDVVDEKEERDEIIEESNYFKTTSIPPPTTLNRNAGSFTLSKLVNLHIWFCPMGSLFETSVAKTLTSLRRLRIIDCGGLKHIVTHAMDALDPSLKRFKCNGCSQLVNISTNRKDDIRMMRQQVNLKLEDLELIYLPQMINTWEATKNTFFLQHLTSLKIMGCEKLEVIFPPCVLRCLPELNRLEVRECKELRQIIEEDLEDNKLSNPLSLQPCFPKLTTFTVEQCHKLKYFTSVSASNDFSNLEFLVISFKNSSIQEWEVRFMIDRIKESYGVSTSNNELPSSQLEQDYMPENTFPLQMNQEDPPTSENKPCSSQVNDNNQSMLGSTAEKIETRIEEKIDRKSEKISDIQAMDQNFPVTSSNMIENIEEIRRRKNEDGPPSDSGVTKTLSGCVDNINLGRGVTIQESSGAYILPQDSQVVKQDDKMNEDEEGIILFW